LFLDRVAKKYHKNIILYFILNQYNMKNTFITSLLTFGVALNSFAVDKNISYPSGKLSGSQIADQVYFVNHFYSFDNYAIGKKGKEITALILRDKGSKPLTLTLERYLNNNTKGAINSQDLAIFRSGKLKGTGMLITDFKDKSKSQSYEIYIPSIRKVRRFAQPAKDDSWGGSDFTFGDVTLRKPSDENHELLASENFNGCLGVMDLPKNQRNKYTRKADVKADCSTDGKNVYKLKSTNKTPNWWYDYRISFVDAETFVDYRTDYFKDGKKIKTIDRSWVSGGLDDKRGNYWGYWYGITHSSGHETMAFIPKSVSKINHKYKNKNLWSTKTLRRMPKKIK
jgi:hypothetical protein